LNALIGALAGVIIAGLFICWLKLTGRWQGWR
jgi:hypothetical protein